MAQVTAVNISEKKGVRKHEVPYIDVKYRHGIVGTLDIVAKWEESVAAKGYAGVLGYPFLLFLACEHLGLLLEELLPCAIAQHVVVVVGDIHVDGVVTVCTADIVNEGQ